MTSNSTVSSFKIWKLCAVALVLFVSSASFAEVRSCSGIFQKTIRLSGQVEETIRQLARLRLRVDLAQTDGKNPLLMKRLRWDFERKQRELVELVEGHGLMTRMEFALKIRQQIAELQGSVQNKNHEKESRREEERTKLKEFINIDGSRAIFYRIEPGSFAMGPWKRTRNVKIETPFEMMATTVTQIIWKKIADLANSLTLPGAFTLPLDPSQFKGDLRPVETVSYLDTQHWIEALNELSARGEPLLNEVIEGHQSGDVYRLPSEEEWEFVVRGRGEFTGEYYFGDMSLVDDYAWAITNSGGESRPVAQKLPIVIGNGQFFDMVGNVSQWMQIPLNPTEFQEGKMSDGSRFVRGGSWKIGLNMLRSGEWGIGPRGRADHEVGFRLVRVVRP
jgi:formylglycine-generating enzyme required for sulfatase activity